MKRIFFHFLISALFFSCTKDKPTGPAGTEGLDIMAPRLTFLGVTPASVKEYTDSLTFQIAYRDSDGDLGENNPDIQNLFVVDNRISVTYGFRIPQLAPSGSNITIEGTIDVVLPNTGITDGSTSQKATFGIFAKDRAGNQSNTVQSAEITVTQ